MAFPQEAAGRSCVKLFVGNLNYATGTSRLREAFKVFDGFVSCKVHRDSITGKSKGYACVKFYRPEFADNAIRHAHDGFLDGRRVIVTHYESARFQEQPMYRRPRLLPSGMPPTVPHANPTKNFCSLLAYGLPPGVLWRDLKAALSICGEVTFVKMDKDGPACVSFGTQQDRDNTIAMLDGATLFDHPIRLIPEHYHRESDEDSNQASDMSYYMNSGRRDTSESMAYLASARSTGSNPYPCPFRPADLHQDQELAPAPQGAPILGVYNPTAQAGAGTSGPEWDLLASMAALGITGGWSQDQSTALLQLLRDHQSSAPAGMPGHTLAADSPMQLAAGQYGPAYSAHGGAPMSVYPFAAQQPGHAASAPILPARKSMSCSATMADLQHAYPPSSQRLQSGHLAPNYCAAAPDVPALTPKSSDLSSLMAAGDDWPWVDLTRTAPGASQIWRTSASMVLKHKAAPFLPGAGIPAHPVVQPAKPESSAPFFSPSDAKEFLQHQLASAPASDAGARFGARVEC